jgi:hypothetical protein
VGIKGLFPPPTKKPLRLKTMGHEKVEKSQERLPKGRLLIFIGHITIQKNNSQMGMLKRTPKKRAWNKRIPLRASCILF